MAYEGIAPISFGTLSMVTTTLGPNDGQVGTRRTEGGREYVLVYNEGGASAAVGCGVVLNSGATGYSVTVSAATSADLVIGVVRNATLTTGAYAWVVSKGFTPVVMGANNSAAVRGLVEIGADGVWASVSNTTGNKAPPAGILMSAAASGASAGAFVSCYG